MISGDLAAIMGHEAPLRMGGTSPGWKRVPGDTSRLPYLLWTLCLYVSRKCLPYLSPCFWYHQQPNSFQRSGQPPYAFIKHFQTGPARLQQPLPAVSVSLFFRLSSGVGNLPELTLASKHQSCPTAAQETATPPLT